MLILLFGITLLAEPARAMILYLLSFVLGENPELFNEIQGRLYFGFSGGYIHLGLFLAIPFIILSSQLFRQIQLVFIPDQKPAKFLLFRPSKLIDLLDALTVREGDSGITRHKSFWNVFFAIVQPVYLLALIFPVFNKIYEAGYYSGFTNAVSWLIQIGASISWIVVLYRVSAILKPAQRLNEPPTEQYVITDEKERTLILRKILALRTIKLPNLVWQLLAAVMLPYLLLGYISGFSLYEQIKIFAENDTIIKAGILSGLFLSLMLVYYLNKLIEAATVFTSYKNELTVINILLFFVPFVSWIWRMGVFLLLLKNWNEAMHKGEFSRRLKLPVGETIALSVFFLLFSFYSSGYLTELIDYIDLGWLARFHFGMYNFMYPFHLVILHVFAMLLVSFTFSFHERCLDAADELESSYSNLLQPESKTASSAE
ncbi:MAG: hypothetical protein ACRC3B_19700 [Bacteroidia bacterium]